MTKKICTVTKTKVNHARTLTNPCPVCQAPTGHAEGCEAMALANRIIDNDGGTTLRDAATAIAAALSEAKASGRDELRAAYLDRTPDGTRLAYLTKNGTVLVTGTPTGPEESHDCDAMGCGRDHVIEILRTVAAHPEPQPPPATPEEAPRMHEPAEAPRPRLGLCPACGINRCDPRWYVTLPCGCLVQSCDGCGGCQALATLGPHACARVTMASMGATSPAPPRPAPPRPDADFAAWWTATGSIGYGEGDSYMECAQAAWTAATARVRALVVAEMQRAVEAEGYGSLRALLAAIDGGAAKP